jgi:WD40 repeat protein
MRSPTVSVQAFALSSDSVRVRGGAYSRRHCIGESSHELHTLTGHADWVRVVAATAEGRCAVCTSDDRTLKVWDLESGGLQIPLGGTNPTDAQYSHDICQRMLSGSSG